MAEAPDAFVVHETPSRLRLKVPSKRHDKSFFDEASRQLSQQMPGARIDINPATASILICGDEARKLDAVSGDGLFRLSRETEDATSQLAQLQRQFQGVNERVARLMGGGVDARTYIIFFLILSAMFQMARGRVFAPAVTLLWYAGEALRAWAPAPGRKN